MTTSLKQVAEKAGVSAATVSRILNDKLENRVPLETRERVRRIAIEMGYQPNRFAQSLREGKTHTLGLIIADLANPVFVSLMKAVEQQAMALGYQVMLDARRVNGDATLEPRQIGNWPVDGVLMWCAAHQTLESFMGPQGRDIPVVYLGALRDDNTDFVTYDFTDGTHAAIQHLIDRGREKMCFVAPYDLQQMTPVSTRVRAYLDVCHEQHYPGRYFVMELQESTQRAGFLAGMAIAAEPLDTRPNALICHNDIIAIGVVHGLRRAGLRVPEDISVVGHDGIAEGHWMDRPLTTVAISPEALSEAALSILMARMSGGTDHAPRHTLIESTFVLGETT